MKRAILTVGFLTLFSGAANADPMKIKFIDGIYDADVTVTAVLFGTSYAQFDVGYLDTDGNFQTLTDFTFDNGEVVDFAIRHSSGEVYSMSAGHAEVSFLLPLDPAAAGADLGGAAYYGAAVITWEVGTFDVALSLGSWYGDGMQGVYDLGTGGATSPTPEPGTLVLLGMGCVGLAYRRRRRAAA